MREVSTTAAEEAPAAAQLPPGLDFPAMFHGVDERVPLDALDFGSRVLTDLLLEY